ncbi:MAG: phosphoribosylamine--glycine ligase [Ignavibacteria bacterium GWA2_55_11]|nr:MAG: phosphoribosylamine--glycine ligase [Ignavibacteria bacterium GWA2_55_11]
MNVLVVGGGGREHAIVKSLRRSPHVSRLLCAPGNAGIGRDAELVPIKAEDINGLLRFVREQQVDLTIVGPEQPLVNGIVDQFRSDGRAVFGPSKSAALLEGSKVFSKAFMVRQHIPTAAYSSFQKGDAEAAEMFIAGLRPPIVVKADGLAAGKGVSICPSRPEAVEAVRAMLSGGLFGSAGESVIIEEFLIGEEASVFVLTDGERYAMLAPAQDHKRVFDNDEGKNTGGMGAYAPAPVVTPDLLKRVEAEVIIPTLKGMRDEGAPYTGCLYVGLMITQQGPKVLEYNCRFGDPETQVVVPLIESDPAEVFAAIAAGRFDPATVHIKDASAVCVVMASGGYPDSYVTGKRIEGLDVLDGKEEVTVYHAGTKIADGDLVTSGGRVLGVTAFGPKHDLATTVKKAYEAVQHVRFEGAHYRNDIGKKGIMRGG